MRLETGKYLRLDAALVERIRMTPGRTVPPVSFTVAAASACGQKAQARDQNALGACTGTRVLRRNGRVGRGALGSSWSSELDPNSFFPFNQHIFQFTSKAPSSKIHKLIFLLLTILQTLHADIKIQI
jgi:hypothetical protein